MFTEPLLDVMYCDKYGQQNGIWHNPHLAQNTADAYHTGWYILRVKGAQGLTVKLHGGDTETANSTVRKQKCVNNEYTATVWNGNGNFKRAEVGKVKEGITCMSCQGI